MDIEQVRWAGLGCAVCFGDPHSLMAHGLNAGVLSLLAVVTGLLISFGVFFQAMRRRLVQYDERSDHDD